VALVERYFQSSWPAQHQLNVAKKIGTKPQKDSLADFGFCNDTFNALNNQRRVCAPFITSSAFLLILELL
jgi:hypothetical protein